MPISLTLINRELDRLEALPPLVSIEYICALCPLFAVQKMEGHIRRENNQHLVKILKNAFNELKYSSFDETMYILGHVQLLPMDLTSEIYDELKQYCSKYEFREKVKKISMLLRLNVEAYRKTSRE